ncbi:hypothetical protein V8C44DRAFT_57893 [Trichoderma aethiopicum]
MAKKTGHARDVECVCTTRSRGGGESRGKRVVIVTYTTRAALTRQHLRRKTLAAEPEEVGTGIASASSWEWEYNVWHASAAVYEGLYMLAGFAVTDGARTWCDGVRTCWARASLRVSFHAVLFRFVATPAVLAIGYHVSCIFAAELIRSAGMTTETSYHVQHTYWPPASINPHRPFVSACCSFGGGASA